MKRLKGTESPDTLRWDDGTASHLPLWCELYQPPTQQEPDSVWVRVKGAPCDGSMRVGDTSEQVDEALKQLDQDWWHHRDRKWLREQLQRDGRLP